MALGEILARLGVRHVFGEHIAGYADRGVRNADAARALAEAGPFTFDFVIAGSAVIRAAVLVAFAASTSLLIDAAGPLAAWGA